MAGDETVRPGAPSQNSQRQAQGVFSPGSPGVHKISSLAKTCAKAMGGSRPRPKSGTPQAKRAASLGKMSERRPSGPPQRELPRRPQSPGHIPVSSIRPNAHLASQTDQIRQSQENGKAQATPAHPAPEKSYSPPVSRAHSPPVSMAGNSVPVSGSVPVSMPDGVGKFNQ